MVDGWGEWEFEVPSVPAWKRPGDRAEGPGRYLQRELRVAQLDIAWCAIAAGVPRLGKERVYVGLWLARDTPGDVDNRAKTLLDALQRGRIIDDDDQVDDLHVRRWLEPGALPRVEIAVRP